MALDPDKVKKFNKGLKGAFTPSPDPQPTSGPATEAPEHDEFSSDKDSEHKKYMKSDKPSSY